jgi:hypothetical protein
MDEQFVVFLYACGGVVVFCLLTFGGAILYRNTFGHKIWVRFLQRTGYRRKADPTAPIEAQARAVLGEIFRPEGVVRGPWVRDIEGQTLTYNSWMYGQGNETVTQESWQLETTYEAQSEVQVLERRLAHPGFFDTLASKALGRERRWGQTLPNQILTGDPSFDERFVVRTSHPSQLPPYLHDQELKRALWDIPEVCLVIAQRWVALDDPAGALRKRHVGNAISPATMMEREPSVHDHAAHTLALVARSVRTESASPW